MGDQTLQNIRQMMPGLLIDYIMGHVHILSMDLLENLNMRNLNFLGILRNLEIVENHHLVFFHRHSDMGLSCHDFLSSASDNPIRDSFHLFDGNSLTTWAKPVPILFQFGKFESLRSQQSQNYCL